MFLAWHSAKQPFFYFLENIFAECNYLGTRRSLKLRRVPDVWHSVKIQTSPSARSVALGEDRNFAECCISGTRRTLDLCRVPRVWHKAKFSTPSCSPVPFASLPVRPSRFNFFCRVPEKRHSAKPASPVEERPCALRRVLHSATSLPSVFLPLPSVSGTRQSRRVR